MQVLAWAMVGLVVVGALSVLLSALRLGIGPVPTGLRVRRVMLAQLPPEVDGTIYELGAGWGGLALALARSQPKARVIAMEASWVPWAFSVLRVALTGVPNLEVRRGDFFATDLSHAQVVVTYLFTGAMARLATKLSTELKPGAYVVSQTFALPSWQPRHTEKANDLYRTPVYRYQR